MMIESHNFLLSSLSVLIIFFLIVYYDRRENEFSQKRKIFRKFILRRWNRSLIVVPGEILINDSKTFWILVNMFVCEPEHQTNQKKS